MTKRITIWIAVATTLVAAATVGGASATTSSSQNIVQTAVAAGRFKTLVSLVKQAGLAGTLAKPGPYTVFAPTDAAFAKVPKATLNALLMDKAKLRAVLLYHVVPGKVTAARVVKLRSAKTVEGQSVRIHVSNGSVFIDAAKVTTPDVMASNGVIHVINKVLIPSSG